MTAVLSPARLRLVTAQGSDLPFAPERWTCPPSAGEAAVLDTVAGPALDIGCGPGRVVVHLARRGVPALGVDVSPSAVAIARHGGALALRRDVFGRLPGEGRWAEVILLDGNIGIGGDPLRLLGRCVALAAPGGRILAEVADAGGVRRMAARVERGRSTGPWFPWATLGADAIALVAAAAGASLTRLHAAGDGRTIAELAVPDAHTVAGSAGRRMTEIPCGG